MVEMLYDAVAENTHCWFNEALKVSVLVGISITYATYLLKPFYSLLTIALNSVIR